MLELYEYPPTRSHRAKWALEELGRDYVSRVVDLHRGEQNSAAYRAIQPLGVVPAIRTDDYTLFESVAIVLQLIDENPTRGLAPKVGAPQRAAYYQWCVFAAAEVDPALMMFFDNTMRPLEAMRPPGTQHNPRLAQRGRDEFAIRARILSNTLESREYLVEPGFSGADIVVGHSCFMAEHMGLLKEFPILEAYFSRLRERPAHQRVYGA